MPTHESRRRRRRRQGGFFARPAGAPAPLALRVRRRVHFREADVMGIAWHGRYVAFFEEAAAALRERCGLAHQDFFTANLRAPVVELHIEYYLPLALDETFDLQAVLVWDDAARLDIEYEALKADGRVAAAGYTVQLFVDGVTGEPCAASPELLERCRQRWKAGEFACLR